VTWEPVVGLQDFAFEMQRAGNRDFGKQGHPVAGMRFHG
jgi:hypothetical protein